MATRSLGTLTLDLVAKVGSFEQGLNKANRSATSTTKSIEKAANRAAKAFVAMGAAVAGATAIVINSSVKQENAIRQLEARLESTEGVSGKTSEGLQELATSLQQLTTFGDETIIEMEALLLTFTNIQGEIFDRTLPAVLDMSVAMGTDLKSSALQLGKALNDPVLGLSALSRAGIQFTDDQKDVIKALVDTGRTAEAQTLVLEELEKQFGGAAEAAADTLGGSITQLKNAFGDLLEAPGGLDDAKSAIQDFTAILQDPAVQQSAAALTTGLIRGFQGVVEAITKTIGAVQFLADEFASITVGIEANDIVRLEDEAAKIQEILSSENIFKKAEQIRFFGPDGVVSFQNDEELRAELDRINTTIADFYSRQEATAKLTFVTETPDAPQVENALAVAQPPDLPDDVPSLGSKRVGETVEALQLQVELLGKTNDEIKLLELSSQGASDSQLALAQAALQAVSVFETEAAAQKALADELEAINSEASAIFDSLRTEEEAIEASYERRRDIILENTEFTGQAQTDLLARLEADRQEQLLAIEQESIDKRNEQVQEGYNALFEIVGSYFDGLEGKRAAAARSALSVVQVLLDEDKRTALQSVIANTEQGIMKAYGQLGPIAGTAAAVFIGAAGAASAAKITGLAHDGIDSVPKTGTFLLEAGERVTTERTSAKLDTTLDNIQRDLVNSNAAGGTGVNIGTMVINAPDERTAKNAAGHAARRISGAVSNASRFS